MKMYTFALHMAERKKNWNGTTKKYKKEEKGQVGPLDCHHEKYDMKIKMMKSTG